MSAPHAEPALRPPPPVPFREEGVKKEALDLDASSHTDCHRSGLGFPPLSDGLLGDFRENGESSDISAVTAFVPGWK